jgi:hypothetical protein
MGDPATEQMREAIRQRDEARAEVERLTAALQQAERERAAANREYNHLLRGATSKLEAAKQGAEAAEQRISELEGALERILRLPDETANQIAADASRRKATMGRRVRTGGIGDPPLIEAERLTAVLQANARLVSRESEQRLVARQERDRAEAAEQERDETRAHWKREYEIEVERSEKVEAELTRVKGERDQLLQDLQDLGPNSLLRTRIEEVAQELEKQAGDARRRSEDAAGDAMWAGVASGISDAASLVRKAAKGEGE